MASMKTLVLLCATIHLAHHLHLFLFPPLNLLLLRFLLLSSFVLMSGRMGVGR